MPHSLSVFKQKPVRQCMPGSAIITATAQLQTLVRWHYSDVQYFCTCVSQTGWVVVPVFVWMRAFTHFPVITLCAVSNEALSVWWMLFNHANQLPARILQPAPGSERRRPPPGWFTLPSSHLPGEWYHSVNVEDDREAERHRRAEECGGGEEMKHKHTNWERNRDFQQRGV